MKKVHIRNYILLVLASLLFVGCSLEKSEGESAVQQPVELVIRASQGGATRAMENVDDVIEVGAELAPAADNSTRTELGPATDTEQPIFWSCYYDEKEKKEVADQIMVWAEPAVNPQGWAFEKTVFSLAHFNHDYHSADFSATVANTMDRDYDYTYYAIYPSPKSRNKQGVESAVSGITLNGTEVTYTLSANQSGEYNPAYDIMWGKVSGAALVERDGSGSIEVWRQPELRMKHLLHMMRIRVPEGRNLLGRDVKRLEITFPQAVVGGTAKVNVKTGEVVWSGQSNKVTIDLPDENLLNANGRYVWVQIKPEVLNGEISFQAYDSAGVPAAEIKSASINKTLFAGRITPVDLTIPSSPYGEGAGLKFIVEKNNLGEQLSNIILSADGYTFIKPFTTDIVSANSISLTPDNNSPQTFTVTVIGNPSSLGISYISAHASIQNRTIPLSTTDTKFEDTTIKVLDTPLQISKMNQAKMVVPYLFYEDFSNVKGFSYNDNVSGDTFSTDVSGTSLESIAGLPGWTGARCGASAGKAIRVDIRTEAAGRLGTARYAGRLDSPKIQNISSAVNVMVSFNWAFANDDTKHTHYAAWGYHSTSGVIGGKKTGGAFQSPDGNTTLSNPITSGITIVGGSYDDISQYTSYIIKNCPNNTYRLAWDVYSHGRTVGNSDAWLYLDNIRVSIAN